MKPGDYVEIILPDSDSKEHRPTGFIRDVYDAKVRVELDDGSIHWASSCRVTLVPTPQEIAERAAGFRAEHLRAMRKRDCAARRSDYR